jgi:hypothetical protein
LPECQSFHLIIAGILCPPSILLDRCFFSG